MPRACAIISTPGTKLLHLCAFGFIFFCSHFICPLLRLHASREASLTQITKGCQSNTIKRLNKGLTNIPPRGYLADVAQRPKFKRIMIKVLQRFIVYPPPVFNINIPEKPFFCTYPSTNPEVMLWLLARFEWFWLSGSSCAPIQQNWAQAPVWAHPSLFLS